MGQMVKNFPTVQETWIRSLGWEDPLEKGMATHSSSLTWSIPWAEEPGSLSPWGHKELDTTERLTLSKGDRLRVGLPLKKGASLGTIPMAAWSTVLFQPSTGDVGQDGNSAAWPTSPTPPGPTYILAVTHGHIPGPAILQDKMQLLMQMHFELFGGRLL